MKLLVDEAVSATHQGGLITIRFKSGHELSFPTDGNPRLDGASEAALNHIELSSFGLHWPMLDEDLSFEGIMRGDYGQQ